MGQVDRILNRTSSAFLGLVLASLLWPQQAKADLQCAGAALAEVVFPGLGYLINDDYDKALIFGGLRWWSAAGYASYESSPNYQEDSDDIYRETTRADGQVEVDIYLSKETYYANAYARLHTNLTLITLYDLYDGGCQENSETYLEILSPFQFWKFGDSLTFWIPTGLQLATPGAEYLTYHVDSELNRDEMQRIDFLNNQLTGVGEEMFFRGVIQRSIYRGMNQSFSKRAARWTSIVLASTLFAVAHDGSGFSAGPGAAFLAGIYLGTVYHPAEGDFNLTEAIAIHSWWNSLIGYKNLRDADFVERGEGETARNAMRVGHYQPLFGFTYRF